MTRFTTLLLALAGVALTPIVTFADDEELELRIGGLSGLSGWAPPVGVSVIAGASVTGFTSPAIRDSLGMDVAALYSLRVTLGSRTGLGVEAGFSRTSTTIHSLTGMQTGTLGGSTFEGALRYNLSSDTSWDPYVSAGVGWQHYDVRGAELSMATDGVNDSDDALVFPVALGVAFRPGRPLVIDVRAAVRANATGDLVLERMGDDELAPMHTWEVGAAVGFDL